MSPRYFHKIDRSTRNKITLEADGPWTMQAPGMPLISGTGGPIVLTFDPAPSSGGLSTLKSMVIDPDPGSGNLG